MTLYRRAVRRKKSNENAGRAMHGHAQPLGITPSDCVIIYNLYDRRVVYTRRQVYSTRQDGIRSYKTVISSNQMQHSFVVNLLTLKSVHYETYIVIQYVIYVFCLSKFDQI